MEEYNNNIEFKTFVDKYCYKHDITPEQAAGHLIVKLVEQEYRNRRLNCKFNGGSAK